MPGLEFAVVVAVVVPLPAASAEDAPATAAIEKDGLLRLRWRRRGEIGVAVANASRPASDRRKMSNAPFSVLARRLRTRQHSTTTSPSQLPSKPPNITPRFFRSSKAIWELARAATFSVVASSPLAHMPLGPTSSMEMRELYLQMMRVMYGERTAAMHACMPRQQQPRPHRKPKKNSPHPHSLVAQSSHREQ